jgi:putative ATPase
MKNIVPLSEQFRPQKLEDILGQPHLVGEDGFVTRTIKSGKPLSIILWGPPGSGKTSIARLYAKAFSMRFVTMSAVFSGIADLKKIVKEAEETPLFGSGTLLFVDEIHRFNKSQQDAFLPFIEKGTIVLVGATTENPSFYLNNALLSRVRILTLLPLDDEALEKLIQMYESKNGPLKITPEGRQKVIQMAQGDGRYIMNMLENIETVKPQNDLTPEELIPLLQKRAASYDKQGDYHYNFISALHKSVRGSDPDASLYWFCRMLEGGEEPLFLARRIIRMATEDIGLADPQALQLAIAAKDTYEMLGSPEGELALAEAVVYLALAPKSNAIYTAYGQARKLASQTTQLSPPAIILNAPTKMMKEMGYGDGYQYDHEAEDAFSGQNYFPDGVDRQEFYHPVERGFEREMIKRIEYFKKLRKDRQKTED